MTVEIRPFTPADLMAVLRLNNDALPAVTELDAVGLEALAGLSTHTLVVDDAGVIAGFLVMLDGPGRDYPSLNYAWFSKRYDSFFYVDRIVVDGTWQGQGLGRRLYEWAIDQGIGQYPVLCAEVNTRPRNQQSLDFHASMGFVEIGEQDSADGTKTVSMLARELT